MGRVDKCASGVHCAVGNRVLCAKLIECMAIRGNSTNEPIAIKPNVTVGVIMELLRRDVDILCFLCFGFLCVRTSTLVWEGVTLCPFVFILLLVSTGA